jgi:hypothetical protein
METAVIQAEIVDRQDVGMVQRARRPRFALETGAAAGRLGSLLIEDLDGDIAAQPQIAGAVHFAHSARAQRRKNLVRPELGSRGQTQRFAMILPQRTCQRPGLRRNRLCD